MYFIFCLLFGLCRAFFLLDTSCIIQRLLTTIYCLISDGNSPFIQSVRLTGQQNKSHINYTDLPTSNDSYRLSWANRIVANRIEVYFEKWHRKKQHQTNFLANAKETKCGKSILFLCMSRNKSRMWRNEERNVMQKKLL